MNFQDKLFLNYLRIEFGASLDFAKARYSVIPH